MVKEILYPLVDSFTAFNVFRYISFRTAYGAVTALLISYIIGPKLIKILTEFRIGQTIRRDGPKTHYVKAGTPTMGGVLIIIAFSISILLWQEWKSLYIWIILLTALGFGCLGFIDDYLKLSRESSDGIRSKVKFSGQLCISFIIMLIVYVNRNPETTQLYVPFLKRPLFDMGILYIPFGMLLLSGMSNAVNLTDGLDGLAVGLVVIALMACSLLAYLTGHIKFAEYLGIPHIAGAGELTIAASSLMGACVGFLWYNVHPAEIMMGDTGSLTLGGLIGIIGILIKKELILLVISGVFIMEVLSVIIQVLYFKRTGKRVFKMAPLHHHFEKLGMAESKIVARFWILGCMFAILGLSTIKIQ